MLTPAEGEVAITLTPVARKPTRIAHTRTVVIKILIILAPFYGVKSSTVTLYVPPSSCNT
jgi:hypothetical protein